MDRARLIVSLAADQARDEATKAWILADEQGIFLRWARDLLGHVPAWEAVALADRRISLLLWGWACESMLDHVRKESARLVEAETALRAENDDLRGCIKTLDERIQGLVADNFDLMTEFASKQIEVIGDDPDFDEFTQRVDEDMCITCDVREGEFEARRENAA